MKTLKSFSVVEFPSANGSSSVEAVPSAWIKSDQKSCYWPRKNLSTLVKDPSSVPNTFWHLYPITRIFSTVDLYSQASASTQHFQKCSDSERDSEYEDSQQIRQSFPSVTVQPSDSYSSVVPDGGLYEGRQPTLILASSLTDGPSENPNCKSFQQYTASEEVGSDLHLTYDSEVYSDTPRTSKIKRPRVNLFSRPTLEAKEGTADENLNTFPSTTGTSREKGTSQTEITSSFFGHHGTDRFLQAPGHIEQKSFSSEKGFQDVVLRKLAKIESNQREMLHLLNAIAGSGIPNSNGNEREFFQTLPDFPLSSQLQLQNFDEYLKADIDFERAVKFFALIGGSTLDHTVKGILKRLLTRELALNLSFTGKGKDNIAFSQYKNVLNMMLASSRRNSSCSSASESAVNKICMDFFRFLRPIANSSSTKCST